MKKLALVVAGVVVLGGLTFWGGRVAYRQVNERRSMAHALSFLEKKDYTRALYFLRRALQMNPANLEASILMAEAAEEGRSPQAVHWRQRVAELAPTLTNQLRLVGCALRFEPAPFAVARETLKRLEPAGRTNAVYHILCSELAMKLQRFDEAEQHLRHAARLEPNNGAHQMRLAALQLRSADAQSVAEGRARLEKLVSDAELGTFALRALAADSLSRLELQRAEGYSVELLTRTNAAFGDHMIRLNILQARKSDLAAALAAAQALARTNALYVSELSAWMRASSMADEALAWVRTLPDSIRSQQPVPIAVAECYQAQEDWKGLEAHVQGAGQSWGEQEPLRLAWLARALERQDDMTGMRLRWQKAVRLAADRLEMMAVLARMADGWRWRTEAEQVLWSIVDKFPSAQWAVEILERSYRAHGDTLGLHKVTSELLSRNPASFALRNNLAVYCLLLKKDLAKAHEYAREVYLHDAKNGSFASTYAFSLHLQGRSAEALRIMGALQPEQLEEPVTAAYYGFMLASAGEAEKATKYLSLAQRAASLVPEEKALLESAAAGR